MVENHFNTLYVFNRTLIILTAVIFCSVSIKAQQVPFFRKPADLNCATNYDNQNGISDEELRKANIRKRVLYEYGAVYVSAVFGRRNARFPSNCVLNEAEVKEFTDSIKAPPNTPVFGDFYLHPAARASLSRVIREMGGEQYVARNCNDTAPCTGVGTKRINNDWALRDYEQTKCNWLDLGNEDELRRCRSTNLALLEIETEIQRNDKLPKMFTSAIPGGSQHHLGLAIDVNNKIKVDEINRICGDACVKSLERNGWFRTIRYDAFHYTYLGYAESYLRSKGLKKVQCKDTFTYWVPKVRTDVYAGYTNPRWRCADVN